jgi:hypothetical protein
MPAFKLPIHIDGTDVARSITPFLQVANYKTLRDRAQFLHARAVKNEYVGHFILSRHRLELSLWDVVNRFRSYGQLPPWPAEGQVDHDRLRAYDFMTLLAGVHRHLSATGKARLEGRVEHGLSDENDLTSLAQEMDIIGNLMQFGCEVTCHDLEGEGGYDFLASRDGAEVEVECKVISTDKGRQIHQYDIVALAERLPKAVDWKTFERQGIGAIVALKVPARLGRNPVLLAQMAKAIGDSVATKQSVANDKFEVRYVPFEVDSSPFRPYHVFTEDEVGAFAKQFAPFDNSYDLVQVTPGRSALVIRIGSGKPMKTVSYTYESLKEGAKQFSGTRPGTLMAIFADMSSEDLEYLERNVPNNGFEGMTTRLFQNEQRRHLHAVHYMSQPDYIVTRDGSLAVKNRTYRIFNENSPFRADPRYAWLVDGMPSVTE